MALTVAAPLRSTLGERRQRFAHQPALDGVRGLSVLLVLLFHGGVSWMGGGYLGVSVFFTLSGFLITRLLLDEHDARGRVNVVRFWGRRLRRLMPASVACLLAVAAFGSLGAFGQVPDLGRELVGAVLQLANWFALSGDASYAEQVLGLTSPLDHVWSLAIEEQFYWVWPLVMVAVMRRPRPDRTIVRLTATAFVAAPLIALVFGSDAAYWATPARAGEILVGASLAAVLHRRNRRPARAVAIAGPPALGLIVWAAVTWPSDGGPAYRGLLPVFALATGALILALQVRSPLRRALAWRPLAGLGVVSYGVYLYHWPLFLLLDGRAGGGTFELGLKLVVTLGVAAASYRWLERPIRRGAGDPGRLARTLAIAFAMVLVVATFGTFGSPDRFSDPASAASQLQPVDEHEPLAPLRAVSASPIVVDEPVVDEPVADRSVSASTAAPATAATPATTAPVVAAAPPVVDALLPGDESVVVAPTRPVRILVVGDSTAWSVGDGLAAWAEANPTLASVTLTVAPGCGFVLTGTVPADEGAGYTERCDAVLSDWMMRSIVDLQPDVVLLMATRTDVKDRTWSADEGVLTNADPRFQERQIADYVAATTWILGAGVPEVVWVKPPVARVDPAPADEMTDPARLGVLHAVIDAAVAGSDPARVSSVDLAGWYARSGIDDAAARLDGIHFEVPAATEVAARLLGPRLVNVALGAA
jgi:peptidoglycan/LPS O-acetylase OafA/YrhL